MCEVSKVFATVDLAAPPHTWTKGLDYELIEGDGYIKLASNQGHINYDNEVKKDVLSNFARWKHI